MNYNWSWSWNDHEKWSRPRAETPRRSDNWSWTAVQQPEDPKESREGTYVGPGSSWEIPIGISDVIVPARQQPRPIVPSSPYHTTHQVPPTAPFVPTLGQEIRYLGSGCQRISIHDPEHLPKLKYGFENPQPCLRCLCNLSFHKTKFGLRSREKRFTPLRRICMRQIKVGETVYSCEYCNVETVNGGGE